MKRLLLGSLLLVGVLSLTSCFVPIPVPVPGPVIYKDADPDPLDQNQDQQKEGLPSEIDWQKCDGGFECADVSVPMNWDDISGEKISIHLVKQPAKNGNPKGSLFVNPGGPGASGAEFIAESINYAVGKDLQKNFDVIGWDPRGVGKSAAVKCYDQKDMDEYLFGDPRPYSEFKRGSDEWLELARQEEKAFADACLENTGDLLEFVDTLSTVKDLDFLRQLVGDEKLHYLGYSYGTFIGSTYAENFPENVGHMVLDGAIAPDVSVFDVVLMQQQGFEKATRAYLKECLEGRDCPFTGTVDEAMKEIGGLLAKIEREPVQASDGRWVSTGTFITAIILPLYNEDNWFLLDDLFEEMKRGETATAQFLADYYYSRNLGYYEDNSTEAFSAINCLDYPPGGDEAQMRKQAAQIAKAAPIFGVYAGYGDISCESWPFPGVDVRGPVSASGADPILVIGTTGDPATPYAWSKELSDQLESGILVTYNGEGHGAYTTGNKCIDQTVEDYFLKDEIPAKDPNC